MTLKRSVLSLFLVLAMLWAIPASASRNVRAAVEAEITNIKIDQSGVLTWDSIDNVSQYQVSIINSMQFCRENRMDLYDYLCKSGVQSGKYNFLISATDAQGKYYSGKGTYEFVSPYTQLGPISNIRVEGNYLVWDHDLSSTPNAKPRYELIIADKGQSLKTAYSNTTRIPLSDFAGTEPNDYSGSITAKCSGYNYRTSGKFEIKGVSVKVEPITGIKYENGTITWDAYPGATDYSIKAECTSGNSSGAYSAGSDTNSHNIGKYAYMIRDDREYTVNVTISARKTTEEGSFTISQPTTFTCVYKYETYPLYVNGNQLTTKTNVKDIFGDGSACYLPSENKLILNNFTGKDFKTISLSENVPVFETAGSLTVTGSANAELKAPLFKVGETLTMDGDCNIVAYSKKGSAIIADKLTLRSGTFNFVSLDSDAIALTGRLLISNKISSLRAKTMDASKTAIRSQNGKIVLPSELSVIEPKNGHISEDYKMFCTSDNKPATNVYISEHIEKPTATPVPTTAPTAAPSGRPTAAPSGRPTSAPSDSPTTSPSANPTGGVIANPTGTATVAPSSTVAPSGKVTTSPKPTSTGDAKKDANAQILAFVERIYIYVLDREPEAEGAVYWSEELYSFRRTGAEVAQGFIFSDEFVNRNTTDEEFVTILYKTFFGRDSEEDGMNFWLSQLATGTMDRVTVANGFIYSQEWADTCASYGIRSGGDLKPSGKIEPTSLTYAFVERMYTTAMGRGYDEEGKQYWASELANFNITGEQCGASFFLSAEMEGYALSDKEYLGRLYATFMNREADADGEAYWLSQMSAGVPRADIVFGFTRSPEFTDKCVEARILPY